MDIRDSEDLAQTKKPRLDCSKRGLLNKSLTVTYSHMAKATLPSAQDVFTSEFGMGSGGSRPLMPSGKPVNPESFVSTLVAFEYVNRFKTSCNNLTSKTA
jgi:hypothetical protein